jgi:hypothetical protein
VRKWFIILISLLLLSGCTTFGTQKEFTDDELMELATGVGDATPMGIWDGREYGVYTSDIKTAQWDVVPFALAYDVRVVWLETGQEYPIAITTGTQMDIGAPRVGHFKVIVRACLLVDCDDTEPGNVSEWADSTLIDFASVDGQPGIWRLYFELTPPSW